MYPYKQFLIPLHIYMCIIFTLNESFTTILTGDFLLKS